MTQGISLGAQEYLFRRMISRLFFGIVELAVPKMAHLPDPHPVRLGMCTLEQSHWQPVVSSPTVDYFRLQELPRTHSDLQVLRLL